MEKWPRSDVFFGCTEELAYFASIQPFCIDLMTIVFIIYTRALLAIVLLNDFVVPIYPPIP